MERKIKKSTLHKACTLWIEFANAGYSWIRLMGNSYAMMLVPILHDLYPNDKEARNAVIARSTQFYNTEPNCGNVINGIAVSMEEKIANGDETITGDDILMLRTSLMGPFAGLGDTFLNLLNSIYLAIFCDIAITTSPVLGSILYIIFRWATILIVGRLTFFYGYNKGSEAVTEIIDSGMFDDVITVANIVGCSVMGALLCQYVTVKCGIVINTANAGSVDVQAKFFDALLPKCLPLLFTLLCWWLITKKHFSVTKLLLVIIGIAIVGGYFGILA